MQTHNTRMLQQTMKDCEVTYFGPRLFSIAAERRCVATSRLRTHTLQVIKVIKDENYHKLKCYQRTALISTTLPAP